MLVLRVVLGPNSSLCVVSIYRPPSAVAGSVDRLAELLSEYVDHEVIVLCDLNLDWLSDNSIYLKEVLENLGLSQLITEPTRPNHKNYSRSTLIDLICTNKPDRISVCGVLDQGISDHCPIVCVRSIPFAKPK